MHGVFKRFLVNGNIHTGDKHPDTRGFDTDEYYVKYRKIHMTKEKLKTWVASNARKKPDIA